MKKYTLSSFFTLSAIALHAFSKKNKVVSPAPSDMDTGMVTITVEKVLKSKLFATEELELMRWKKVICRGCYRII